MHPSRFDTAKLVLVALVLAFASCFAGVTVSPAAERRPETRLAFVVGNESYAAGALPTAANDAGLVAQTLQAAGFAVLGARDLDAETFRQSYSEFLRRVAAAGPDTVAFVYVAGYGVQYGTDNYYVPIGADVSRDLDIPIAAIRLSDLTGPLDAMNIEARFEVFDVAYKLPFQLDGASIASGLAAIDAVPGTLVAANAAPGTVAQPGKGNYGLYAQSLAAMLREPGVAPDVIFDRVRLRVNEASGGDEVPWDDSKIDAAFRFFERGPGAPGPVAGGGPVAALLSGSLKALPVKDAYTAAIARDSLGAYGDFEEVYGGDPLAKRVRVLLAVRREALTWRRTVQVGTPAAYWSYLKRYAKGPHADAARARLTTLAAGLTPPPGFVATPDDIAPPPQDELPIVDQPFVTLEGPDLPPPPPVPSDWLPPIPAALLDLPAPPPPGLFFLPVPGFVPLPDYCDPPGFVVFPFDNYFYGGLGRGRLATLGDPRVVSNIHHGFPPGNAGRGVDARAVALPAAALQRAGLRAKGNVGTPRTVAQPMEQRLPGENGRRLPPTAPLKAAAAHKGEAKAARPARTSQHAAAKPGRRGPKARKARAGGAGTSAKAGRAGRGKAAAASHARRPAGHASRASAGRHAHKRAVAPGHSTRHAQASARRQTHATHRPKIVQPRSAGRTGGLASGGVGRHGGARPGGLAGGRRAGVGGLGGGLPARGGLGGRPGGLGARSFGGGRPGGFGGFGGPGGLGGRPGGSGGGRPAGLGGGFRGGGFGGGGHIGGRR